jgi:hypothetical protein
MKKLILIIAATLLYSVTFANPVNKAASSGKWQNSSTWNQGRAPLAGDTIVIPLGKIVTVEDNEDLGLVYIKVYGILKFSSGKLNLADNSIVRVYSLGRIEGSGSNSEQLRIGNDKVFRGSDPAVLGPMMADGTSSIFSPFAEVLPVKFLGFSAVMKNKDVLVQWSTTEEVNASVFELERSYDASNWSTIAYVAATGNSSATTNYSYTDKNITSGTVYYRVKQVDMDGKFTLTPIRSVKPGTIQKTEVNIASMGQSKVLLQFPKEISGTVVVRFTSPNGQLLAQQTLSKPFGQVVLNTTANLKGNYIISLTNGQDLNVASKVIL